MTRHPAEVHRRRLGGKRTDGLPQNLTNGEVESRVATRLGERIDFPRVDGAHEQPRQPHQGPAAHPRATDVAKLVGAGGHHGGAGAGAGHRRPLEPGQRQTATPNGLNLGHLMHRAALECGRQRRAVAASHGNPPHIGRRHAAVGKHRAHPIIAGMSFAGHTPMPHGGPVVDHHVGVAGPEIDGGRRERLGIAAHGRVTARADTCARRASPRRRGRSSRP